MGPSRHSPGRPWSLAPGPFIVAVNVTVAACPAEARVTLAPVETPWVEAFPERQIDPSVPTAVPWTTRPPEPSANVSAASQEAWYDAAQREFEVSLSEGEEPEEPRRGLGVLIPGVVFLGAVIAVAITDVVVFSRPEPCQDVCLPLSALTWPLLFPGVPMTVVGAVRVRRHGEWKQGRVAFMPRLSGFSLRF